MKIDLNDDWTMTFRGTAYPCRIPCSMYDTLINAGAIPDPYVGENEVTATPLSDEDTVFERKVVLPEDLRQADRIVLRFDGIDTLSDVSWDGTPLGHTDNMHRAWEFPLPPGDKGQEHLLRLNISSPTRYIAKMQRERPLWGVDQAIEGYPWMRKAHSTFGWDWGIKLPDMGIWRDVTLMGYTGGRILSVRYAQQHEKGCVTLTCLADLDLWAPGIEAEWTVTAPGGQTYRAALISGRAEIRIPDPELWWVRGLGPQPLYRSRVTLRLDGAVLDEKESRIGLRTLTVSREKDAWGQEFCLMNNGVRFFAMGADYIPDDQLLPRCTKERVTRTLKACVDANYNFIRVWGGGFYPGDAFYDLCDENGIAVWQDFMFACSAYRLTPDFEKTVRAEIRDNVIRLRDHPSLALWCGNNEIETAWTGWGLPEDPEARADYLTLFEKIIPEILSQEDPDTFYWPSSPSSGGGFINPEAEDAGDMHYWSVWHGFKPIEDFRKHHYRFCSEYGFESLPDIRTVRYFAGEEQDLCGHLMESHQKCAQGTEKLLYYLGQMVNYPRDMERLIYCSQTVQADSIRFDVEHMRRSRGRCMGSAYWQVNDSCPVISWSSIDVFGRWKALHYAAKRFYAPILLSCDDLDPARPVFYVINDTRADEQLSIVCRLRDRAGEVLRVWSADAVSPALSSVSVMTLDLKNDLSITGAPRSRYLEYALIKDGNVISRGTTLFVRPKSFDFLPAEVRARVTVTEAGYAVALTADRFVKGLRLSLKDADAVFSDNWFDLHPGQEVTVTVGRAGLTPDAFREQLEITSYFPGTVILE